MAVCSPAFLAARVFVWAGMDFWWGCVCWVGSLHATSKTSKMGNVGCDTGRGGSRVFRWGVLIRCRGFERKDGPHAADLKHGRLFLVLDEMTC